MVVITLSGILAGLAAAISAVTSVGSFLANIAILPFKVAGDNKMFAIFIYWIVFFIDSFIFVPLFSAVTNPLFKAFGLEGIELGFTSIYLIIVNIFASFLFGWFFVPFHLLIIATLVLLLQFAAWMYTMTPKT